MEKNIQNVVLEILEEINTDVNFLECEDFFEEELIDSMGVITMISILEERFSINILPEDITAEYFMNVQNIVDLINKYVK